MQHLRILSFHDIGGRIIPATTCRTAADPVVLKPIINGNLGDCRPDDIKFVCVQLLLDFTHLLTAPPVAGVAPPSSTLCTEYYIAAVAGEFGEMGGECICPLYVHWTGGFTHYVGGRYAE